MSAENKGEPATNDEVETNAAHAPSVGEGAPTKTKTSLMLIAGVVCSLVSLLVTLGGLAYLHSVKADQGELRGLRAELKKREVTIADLLLRTDNLTAEVVRLSEAEDARAEAAEKARAEAEKAREAAAQEAAELAEKAEKLAADKGAGKVGGKSSESPVRRGDKGLPIVPLAPVKRPSDLQHAAGARSPAPVVPVAPAAPGTPSRLENKVESKPAAKGSTQNCDLTGKTPEEQAATLKRCVSLIDPPSQQPRQR